MAKGKAGSARGDALAGEAWAAGCRDVQAAINWAAGKGVVPGPPFQAAFRRRLAAEQGAPAAAAPTAAPADPGTGVAGDRGKRGRRTGRGGAESAAPPAERTARGAARPKAGGTGPATAEPVPRAAAAIDPAPGSPAEFVEDMRRLRHLVAKYGKKGLSDLIQMFGG